MDMEAFERKVAIIEDAAKRSPRAYRFRVFALALLGYAYLGLVLLLLIALLAASVISVVVLKFIAIKAVVVLAGLSGLLLRAMWVDISAPRGLAVSAGEAPELFARIDRLRRKLRAPKFHRVLITDEFNAGVVQVPRLGAFGWQRNYLLLGLPLLKILTPRQLDAVLAHELGHLAGGHARFGNWLYRMRATWTQLEDELERRRSRGAFLFKNFFDWYVPYFNAYTFPLARMNEYEADRASAELAGSATAAEALTAVKVIGKFLSQRFWPAVFSKADEEPAPTAMPFTQLARDIPSELHGDDVRQWLGAAMAERPSVSDTHPGLSQRLRAIGESPHFAPPAPGEGAEALLGAAHSRIEQYLNVRWQDQVAIDWRKRFEGVREGRQKLAQLTAKSGQERLDADAALERAALEEAFGSGPEAALEQLRSLHDSEAENASVAFALGQRLLQRMDVAGVELLQTAMRLDDRATVPSLRALCDYYRRQGDVERANQLHERLVDEMDLRDAAQRERQQVLSSEVFDEHGFDPVATESLRRQLSDVAELKEAYLVRKRVNHMPEHPCYLLGFTTKSRWERHNAARVRDVQRRILDQVEFPAHTVVFSIEAGKRSFAAKLRRIPGARLV